MLARFRDAREARMALEEVLATAGPLTTGQLRAWNPAVSEAPTLPSVSSGDLHDSNPLATPPPISPIASSPYGSSPYGSSPKLAVAPQVAASPHAMSTPPIEPRLVAPTLMSAQPPVLDSAPPRAHNDTASLSTSLSDEPAAPMGVPTNRGPLVAILGGVVALAALGGVFAIAMRGGGDASATTPSASSSTSSAAPASSASSTAPVAPFASARPKKCPAGTAFVSGGAFFASSRTDTAIVEDVCIDVDEVTVDEYAACAKSKKCTDAGLKSEVMCNYGERGRGKHPINCVDFDQASAYCAAQGMRLPTEDEWQWVARNGDAATTYPWGDDAPKDQLCWSGDVDRTMLGTCENDAHLTGKTGVHDLAGNVAEWVTTSRQVHESVRPLLGGSWKSKELEFTRDGAGRPSVAGQAGAREAHSNTVGFRCAATPK
jgi:formylglycine-generating enzyme required for sulfatase activity